MPQTRKETSKATPQPEFPFLDLTAQFAAIREEVTAAVMRVLESQQFILGQELNRFEEEIKPVVGSRHAVGCASGSDALLLALMALGVGPGDEVIVPAFTFVATAGAVARLQAKPVFVDIDPATYNLDAGQVEKAIGPRTRAMIAVHLFGLPADMDALLEVGRRKSLAVIEDAAQAIGASHKGRPVGSMGLMSCFSFFPSKNLGGAGDGGMLATDNAELADRVRVLRDHGSREKYQYQLIGTNSRLDEMQAAVLRVKLKHLEGWTQARRRVAETYRQLLGEAGLDRRIQAPWAPPGHRHVYHQFTIRTQRRDELKRHLQERGVPSAVYYPSPLHLQPAFAYLGHHSGDLPESERACSEVLSLPIYPELRADQLEKVVESMAEFFAAGS